MALKAIIGMQLTKKLCPGRKRLELLIHLKLSLGAELLRSRNEDLLPKRDNCADEETNLCSEFKVELIQSVVE